MNIKRLLVRLGEVLQSAANTHRLRGMIYVAIRNRARIHASKVLLESRSGIEFIGNPYYLAKRILEEDSYSGLKVVIVGSSQNPSHREMAFSDARISYCRPDSIRYAYHLATAAFLVNDEVFPDYFTRRDGQQYLNTGRGTLLEAVDRTIAVSSRLTPAETGFDAVVEFAPDWRVIGPPLNRSWRTRLRRSRNAKNTHTYNRYSYDTLVRNMLAKPQPAYKQFRCVTPSWDKTARRQEKADLWVGSTPEKYRSWLSEIVRRASESAPPSEQVVFVNAWNEWAEGCYLEPDQRYGRAYLEATQRALEEN